MVLSSTTLVLAAIGLIPLAGVVYIYMDHRMYEQNRKQQREQTGHSQHAEPRRQLHFEREREVV
jgi:hypothetical protein